MQLRELLGDAARGAPTVDITALAYDNRLVTPGTLFFCVPGFKVDGHDFAADAVRRGASTSLTLPTTSWGASRSRGRCTHRAAAPASSALPARSWPSTLDPGTQQNSAPGTTLRVSRTTSVTVVPPSPRTWPWTAGARRASGTRRDVKVMTFEARVVGSDGRRRVRRRPLATAIPWPGRRPAKA